MLDVCCAYLCKLNLCEKYFEHVFKNHSIFFLDFCIHCIDNQHWVKFDKKNSSGDQYTEKKSSTEFSILIQFYPDFIEMRSNFAVLKPASIKQS